MVRIPGSLRKLAMVGAVAAAGLVWVDTFVSSSGDKEWTGFWGATRETRGKVIDNRGRAIETMDERELRLKREARLKLSFGDTLDGVRGALGDRRKTRGDDIKAPSEGLPPEFEELTPRQVCLAQQLEFPDRFKDLDCMTDTFDSPEPQPREPARAEVDAGASGARYRSQRLPR